jgi:hypothetical protein
MDKVFICTCCIQRPLPVFLRHNTVDVSSGHQDLLTWQGSFLRIRISGYFSLHKPASFTESTVHVPRTSQLKKLHMLME